MRCVSPVIHKFMRSVEIDGDKVGGIEISTGLSSIERRVGAACAVAKWKMGGNNWLTKVKIGYII